MARRNDNTPPPTHPRSTLAAQELRLISVLGVLLGAGLFLALPFVLSIGSVVFLPVVAAIILSIVLSPLADRLAAAGLPNVLASLIAVSAFIGIVLLAVALILQPATEMFDNVQPMLHRLGQRFTELHENLDWLNDLNRQLSGLIGRSGRREVVLATPSILEELAFATPSLVLEMLLTLLMTFFMVETRIGMRRHLLQGRARFGTSQKAARAMREVQDRVAAYILTISLINLCVGVIVAAGAWALGVKAPIMWGGLAAILNFLPYVGPLAMAALLGLFGLGTADTLWLGLIPALCYLGLHATESNVITPAILGARFTMNPVMILIALSYFSWIWGIAGALLSVPILLTLTALVDHLGRPNLVGFIFGEPLFASHVLDLRHDGDSASDAPSGA